MKFEIVQLLGQGGMGAVCKARQPALDRWIALKLLPPQTAAKADFSERFNREDPTGRPDPAIAQRQSCADHGSLTPGRIEPG